MTAQQALAWALSQVGVTENPAGSNRVRYWDDVLPEFQGSPWCGAFVWDALKRAGADLSWSTAKRFAYTPSGLADARKAGLVHSGPPRPGDIVWYSFDGQPGPEHVGLVDFAERWPVELRSVEGNTSLAGSQSNGGQVLRRWRSAALVAGFATPIYPAPAPAAAAPPEEEPVMRTLIVRCAETGECFEVLDTQLGPRLFYVPSPDEIGQELALKGREVQYATRAEMEAEFTRSTAKVIA